LARLPLTFPNHPQIPLTATHSKPESQRLQRPAAFLRAAFEIILTFVEPGIFLLAEDKKEKIARMGVYINNFKETSIIMAESLGIEHS